MFCPNCGSQLADTAVFCTACGANLRAGAPAQPAVPPPAAYQAPPQPVYQQPGQAPVNIPNYLVQAILVTIFCCWPLGIVAIIKAASVNSKIGAGDVQGAMQASAEAKKWCWITAGSGLVIMVIYMALMALGVLGSIMGSHPANF